MEKVKEVPYGVADFVTVMEQNLYYVDKTMFIPELEKQPRNLFFIRPQRKQEKETNEMRNNLAVGDEIVTIGGIIGIIIAISSEDTVTIVTSRDRTRMHILKSAISRVTVPVNGGNDDKSSDAKKEKTDAPAKPEKEKKKLFKKNTEDKKSDSDNSDK